MSNSKYLYIDNQNLKNPTDLKASYSVNSQINNIMSN